MALASSANNIGSDSEFILLYIFLTIQAPELMLGELHVSISTSQRKKFELHEMILLQLSVIC